jgi:hypothetical protein
LARPTYNRPKAARAAASRAPSSSFFALEVGDLLEEDDLFVPAHLVHNMAGSGRQFTRRWKSPHVRPRRRASPQDDQLRDKQAA